MEKKMVEETKQILNVDFPIPAEQRPKLSGFEFYNKTLGAPKYVVSIILEENIR